ncbi:MAG TPA: PAS domain-containing protein [Candidatus Sulfotelmatobacter sp.]|nr:PAS domain-containing protein [Candidatus Sulfotelmatobacter sp.]
MSKEKDGIWIIDKNATTLYANAAMAEILGTDGSQLIGQPSFKHVFPEDVARARCLFEARERGESAPFHFRIMREDGSAIWVDVQGTPMFTGDHEFIGIVGTFSVSDSQLESEPWCSLTRRLLANRDQVVSDTRQQPAIVVTLVIIPLLPTKASALGLRKCLAFDKLRAGSLGKTVSGHRLAS